MRTPAPNKLSDVIRGAVPPSDLEAEGYVLSWGLFNDGDIDRAVATGLQPQHFYADANRRIWEAIVELSLRDSKHVDIVSVAGLLRMQGRLDQVGGTPYLAMLCDAMPVEAKTGILEQHCRTILSAWTARQVQSTAWETIARLYEPEGATYASIIEHHETEIWELAHQDRETLYENSGVIAGAALTDLAEALRSGGHIGASTGFPELDRKTGGYQKGQLVVIAARTGLGKSAFLASSVIKTTRLPPDGSPPDAVYLHSLEMPKEEVSLRLVCIEANVEYAKMKLNQLTRGDWDKLFRAADVLVKQPLLIGDRSALTVQELRSIIRKIKREITLGKIFAKGLVLAAVDYLQFMSGDKSQSRELEISSMTRGLKETSKSEGLCVVALSQLNRETEKKTTDHRPRLDNLRESGAIENDADHVWFIYREKYYNKDANDEAELNIAKQRGGAVGTAMLVFHGPTISFRSLASGYEEMGDFAQTGGDIPGDEYWNP